ncbi:MAG TPA: hypothetical protein VLV83_21875 [Acidobacteriota bacterium]|nr:hypothetical protein [Acidobacteriota bacterium]
MDTAFRKATLWIAKGIGLAYLLLLMILSLDAFSLPGPWWQDLIGFAIHLIPAAIFGAALWLAWKHPMAGALTLIALGLLFTFYFSTFRAWPPFLSVSMPLFLTAFLFAVAGWPTHKPAH